MEDIGAIEEVVHDLVAVVSDLVDLWVLRIDTRVKGAPSLHSNTI